MSAIFAIDQSRPGPSPGTPGVPRKDIWQGWQVNLRSTGTAISYQWILLDRPPTSAATILNATSATANITPDVPGSYRVLLITSGGGPGNIMTLVFRVRFDNTGALVNRGWALPALGETAAEDDFDGLGRGWAEFWEEVMPDLLSAISSFSGTLAGEVTGPTGATVVSKISTKTLSGVPTMGQFLTYNGTNLAWVGITTFTPGGDLSGSDVSQTVIGIQGRPVANTAPTTGQFYSWDGSQFAIGTTIGTNVLTAGGVDAAAALSLGGTTATSVSLGRVGIPVTINGDVTFTGLVTRIISTDVDIADRYIRVNYSTGIVPVPTLMAGIGVERGSPDGVTPRDAAAWIWDESLSRWRAAFNTAADGTTIGAAIDAQFAKLFITALRLAGFTKTVLAVDASGDVVADTSLPLPLEIPLVAGVANVGSSVATRIGSRIIDLTGIPSTLPDGRTLTAKFVVAIETTAGTANVQLKNMTDNELVSSTSFSTTNTQSTEFSGTLTVGVAAGNLKTGKLYEVQLYLTGGSGLDRASSTSARLLFTYA